MLNQIAEQQLRKAGWYPGRKIDISDQIEFWESLGYQTFDAAVKFMEEYGKLHITDKYIFEVTNNLHEDHHSTFVTEILEFYNEYTEEERFEFNLFGYAKENILPVVQFNDGDTVFFIGESGAIYCGSGLIAENSEILWNEYYGKEYGTTLFWDEIGMGKQRRRCVRKTLSNYL